MLVRTVCKCACTINTNGRILVCVVIQEGKEEPRAKRTFVLVSCQYGELHQHNDKFDPETKAEGLKISKSDSLGMNLTHGQS